MSETKPVLRKDFESPKSQVKHRKYTYKEEKLNNMSEYEQWKHFFGSDVPEFEIQQAILNAKLKPLSQRKLTAKKKEIDEIRDKKHYEKWMKGEYGEFENHCKSFNLHTRFKQLGFGFSNSEAYALTLQFLIIYHERKKSESSEISFSEVVNASINRLENDWSHVMDTDKHTFELNQIAPTPNQ